MSGWELGFWLFLVGLVLWPMRPGREWRNAWETQRKRRGHR